MATRRSQGERSETSVARILDSALELFSTRGYGATSLRQIAQQAGLSVGNIYHHFPDKEAIYHRLIERYWERLLDPALRLNRVLTEGRFPDDLEEIAAATEEVVEQNAAHILLIYVDVIEFGGKHIRAFYEGMAQRYQRAYSGPFAERREAGDFGNADPLIAVMVATRWLFYFFTVEKCFGVPMHFGMTPQQAVAEFIRLLRFGLLPRTDGAPTPPRAIDRPHRALDKTKAKPRSRPKGGRKS